MPSLLDDFYSEDLSQYYYVEDSPYYYADSYYGDGDYYYVDEGDYYYVDENDYYYVEEPMLYYSDEILYYGEEAPVYYADELMYYEEEEPNYFFKKEVMVAPQVINTPRDAQGNSWDAASYEIDREIENIAHEEGVDYATAYRMLGQRYETYEPDLSEYL